MKRKKHLTMIIWETDLGEGPDRQAAGWEPSVPVLEFVFQTWRKMLLWKKDLWYLDTKSR